MGTDPWTGHYWLDYELGHVWFCSTWDSVTGDETRREWKCIGKSPIKARYYKITDPRTGKSELLHRYMYSMYHSIPLKMLPLVDHIDRNPKNNAISNLRQATILENLRNSNRYDPVLQRTKTYYDHTNGTWIR